MPDYTDIESKIEDADNALDSLYNLIYSQYDNVFSGDDQKKYLRMLDAIKSAGRCLNEVSEINIVLSDKFEDELDRLSEEDEKDL